MTCIQVQANWTFAEKSIHWCFSCEIYLSDVEFNLILDCYSASIKEAVRWSQWLSSKHIKTDLQFLLNKKRQTFSKLNQNEKIGFISNKSVEYLVEFQQTHPSYRRRPNSDKSIQLNTIKLNFKQFLGTRSIQLSSKK